VLGVAEICGAGLLTVSFSGRGGQRWAELILGKFRVRHCSWVRNLPCFGIVGPSRYFYAMRGRESSIGKVPLPARIFHAPAGGIRPVRRMQIA
jgi:hypothetical protein